MPVSDFLIIYLSQFNQQIFKVTTCVTFNIFLKRSAVFCSYQKSMLNTMWCQRISKGKHAT